MNERQALGIDINKFARTGGINYDLLNQGVQAGIIDFLIISTGVGTGKSPIFDEQQANVERLGIPYVTYHLIDPRNDIKEQVHDYISWVGSVQPNYIIDIESPDGVFRAPNKAEIMSYIDELSRLTGKQPILYSRIGLLAQVGFLQEASKYRLWVAQWMEDSAKTSKANPVYYRLFEDFVRDFAGRLPPSVINTPLQNNVVLWQFSAKGDGRHYIYNATTADPQFSQGMFSADLNISIQGRAEFMQFMFGRVPDIHPTGDTHASNVVTHDSQPGVSTYPGLTNQDMINLIFKAARPFTGDPWKDWVVRAGMESLGIPSENRGKPYTGPKIEDLPNLTGAEKSAILVAFGTAPVTDGGPERPASNGVKAIFTPAGQAIARCVAELNKAGKPVWSIFPRDDAPVKDRIFFKTPLEVEPQPVTGDGGAQCYKLIASPISTDLYVRVQDGAIKSA